MQDHDISSVKNIERYKGFTFLERPSSFEDLMKGRDIPVVQVHDAAPVDEGIVGFCGVFEWKGGEAVPLDGDIYNKGMTVLGYEWFIHEGEMCLDVLVAGDW